MRHENQVAIMTATREFVEQPKFASIDPLKRYALAILSAILIEVVGETWAAQLVELYIKSDQDITVKTNDPDGNGTGFDDEFNIEAGKPFIWYEGCGQANPFTGGTVESLSIKNLGSAVANVRIRTLANNVTVISSP
jgi:hypothetical protein